MSTAGSYGAVGIDLGTTYARIAVWDNDHVKIIPNDCGNDSTPSYVAFTDYERILGDAAEIQAVLNPHNTVFNVKRLLGRAFSDPGVQSDIVHYPFTIFDRDSKPCIRVEWCRETREFTPEEILAVIFTHLKETAEAYLGVTVTFAVVAVPFSFDFLQRQAVWRAATTSGLRSVHLTNETSCSSVAYCLDRSMRGPKYNVLILDVGGSNTNVSLSTIEEGICEVKTTSGEHHLGGEDVNRRLVAHLAQQFKREYGTDLTGNAHALLRLRTASEDAKRSLSTTTRTSIVIDSLYNDVDLYTSITRAEFEELCQDLFMSMLEPIKKVLLDARIDKSGVHEVVLVGGSARIPGIRKIVSDFFDGKQPSVLQPLDPETTLVRGAAMLAANITGRACEKTQNMMPPDVIPHSLGIQTNGGVMTPLVRRNSTIPTKRVKIFTTTHDNQCEMLIKVYEGEQASARARDKTLLGRLLLSGIPPAPRSVPQIKVTFSLVDNQHLVVIATNRDYSKRSTTLSLNISGGEDGLSDGAIADMVAADIELSQFKTYARNLRMTLQEIGSALEDTEAWLQSGSTSCATIGVDECETRRSGLSAAVRPAVAGLLAASEAGPPNPSQIPAVAGVVDEATVRRWVETRLPGVKLLWRGSGCTGTSGPQM